MTMASFVVFMFVGGVAVMLMCAWFVSDFVFKRLYLKDLEQRLAAVLEKHGIEVQEEDYHSKFIACSPSSKEIVSMLEAVYGIDNKALIDKDFSAFQEFLQNTMQTQTRTDYAQTPADSKKNLVN